MKNWYFCRLNGRVGQNFMKKILYILSIAALLASCKNQYDAAMKSTDKDVILSAANDMYSKKKWKEALALYERAAKLVAGTDELQEVLLKTAYAEYYDKNYKLAASHFKRYAATFPNDERAEEAAYMAALNYYQGSLQYNLDQTSTESAINEMQSFLNSYPDSEKAKNINELIEELSYKLEYKAYENARQFFKMGEYKAANASFENVLDDFPATTLRPKIYDYIMKSRYELAMNSIYSLKEERIENALSYARFLEKNAQGTDAAKTAAEQQPKLLAEKERFAKVKADTEKHKEKLAEKQKAEEARASAKRRKKLAEEGENDLQKSLQQTDKARIDSAEASTPAPAITLPVKN